MHKINKDSNHNNKNNLEILKKQMETDGIAIIIVSYLILILIGFLLFVAIINSFMDGINSFLINEIIFLGFVFLFGLCLFILGIKMTSIKHSPFIKKYPEIIELVNDLYNNIIFERGNLIIPQLAIAPKSHLISTVNRYNVEKIYINDEQLILHTKNRKIHILHSIKKKEAENILKTYCPNAQIFIR